MVQREFFDNYVTNMQVEDTSESERLDWLDEWAMMKAIKRDCSILVNSDIEMETLAENVFSFQEMECVDGKFSHVHGGQVISIKNGEIVRKK